jgi:serine/threonine protein kinase
MTDSGTDGGMSRWLRTAAERLGVVPDELRVRYTATSTQALCAFLHVSSTGENFVYKMMSPEYPFNSAESTRREFLAVRRFSDATRARGDIGTPDVVALTTEPMGYLMREVEGVDLLAALRVERMSADRLRTTADAIVAALDLFHRTEGEMYGDFHPENILIGERGRLFFIDPLMADPKYDEATEGHAALAADLGFWTFSIASMTPRRLSVMPFGAARLLRLTRAMLRRARASSDDPDRLAQAIRCVMNGYLAELRDQGARGRLQVLLARAVLPLLWLR